MSSTVLSEITIEDSDKWKRYPEYKDSGVEWLGEIPEGWDVNQLKNLTNLVTGNTPPKAENQNYENGTIPWVKPEDLIGSEPIFNSKEHLSEMGTKLARLIPVGSALVCCIGSVGKVGVAGTSLATNQQINAVLFNREDIWVPGYGIYSLIASEQEHKRHANTVVVSILNKTGQGFIKFPVPPLPEQHAIAAFLDRKTAKIDTLIEKKRRLISLLEEKRAAIISHAVTKGLDPDAPMKDSGVESWGKIPAHWDMKKLRHLVDDRRPIMYGIVLPGPNVDDGVPIVKGGNCEPGKLYLDCLSRTSFEIEANHARSRLRGGDLVYAIRGSIGMVEIVPDELDGANLTQDAARISPRPEVNRYWLLFTLRSLPFFSALDAGAIGATIRGINIRDLKRGVLAVPPYDEQCQITEYLNRETTKIDALISKIQDAINKLQEYRTALISAAVTGKIDVREASL